MDITKQIIDSFKKTYAYVELDADATIIDANDTYCNLLGYEPHELIGNHHRVTAPPDVANSEAYKQFLSDLKNGKSFLREAKRINRKNGNIVYFTASYSPVVNENGEVFKIIILANDTTTSKLMEEKVATISMMIEKSPASIFLVNPTGVLTYLNLSAKSELNKIKNLIPKNLDSILNNELDWLHPDRSFFKTLISTPERLPYNTKIKLGSEDIELSLSAITDDNNKYLGAMIDWKIVTNKENLISNLNSSSNELTNSAEKTLSLSTSLSAAVEEMTAQSLNADNASKSVQEGMKTLVNNMQEMSISIQEITKMTNESSHFTNQAMSLTKNTEVVISDLGQASIEIGNVTKVISSIAQQTNLLALNATIEAARAGDAGKGFSVVANEVKELAKQTAKATENIAETVRAIQSKTKSAVDSNLEISQAISRISQLANNIAASMEEQYATTKNINHVVQTTEKDVQQIGSNINEVSSAISITSRNTLTLKDSANELEKMSNSLKKYIEDMTKL